MSSKTITFYPSSAGDHTGISSQYPATGYHWDKMATMGNNATYVYQTSAADVYDLYGIDAQLLGGRITDVKITGVMRGSEDSRGYHDVFYYVVLKTNSTVHKGTTQGGRVFIEDQWGATFRQSFSINPVTSAQWDWSEIYNLQIGIGMDESSGALVGVHATGCAVTITYDEDTTTGSAIVGYYGVG